MVHNRSDHLGHIRMNDILTVKHIKRWFSFSFRLSQSVDATKPSMRLRSKRKENPTDPADCFIVRRSLIGAVYLLRRIASRPYYMTNYLFLQQGISAIRWKLHRLLVHLDNRQAVHCWLNFGMHKAISTTLFILAKKFPERLCLHPAP